MKSFFALVPFTDAKGAHSAGDVVNLPYETDEDIANALSMIRYGVISERAPDPDPRTLAPNFENTVVAQQEPTPLPPPNDENAVDPRGNPVTHDHSVESAGDQEPEVEQEPQKAPAKRAPRKKR